MSIDLFQGSVDEFACDKVVVPIGETKEAYQQAIRSAYATGSVRHIVITPTASEPDAPVAMASLRELRDVSQGLARKRITFVLPNPQLYKEFQTALFNCFSDC